MAEITASFGGKEITITYPDEMAGKALEAFVSVKEQVWLKLYREKLDALDEDEPSEEQLADWKHEFTVSCVVGYVMRTIRQYNVGAAVREAKSAVLAETDEQIELEIN